MKKIFSIAIAATVLLLISCGGSDDGPPPPPPPPPPPVVTAPNAASLVFPENNSLCTEAKDLTGNPGDPDRTYTISFRWTGETNNMYEVSLTNEDDNTTRTANITATATNIVLDIDNIVPGANYSWVVTASKNGTTETADSAEQTFTAAGIAAVSFAPYAATPVSPAQNASLSPTTSVTLDWTARDDDDDITEYDVYFGEDNPPATLIETITDPMTTSKEVDVVSDTIYFWRIVTRDAAGNETTSAVFRFVVQ